MSVCSSYFFLGGGGMDGPLYLRFETRLELKMKYGMLVYIQSITEFINIFTLE